MPELALTYAPEPPWLREPKQSGLSIQDILSTRQEGRLQRQEERLTTESQLRQRGFEQDLEMNRLKIAEAIRLRDETLEAERLAEELAKGPVASLLDAGDVEGALEQFMSAGIRYPKLRSSKAYATMADDLRFSLQVKENAAIRRENAETRTRIEQERLLQAEERLRQGWSRLRLQQEGFSYREIDQALRALGMGVEINRPGTPAPAGLPTQPGAAVPATPAPTQPLFKAVERPPTTATVTDAQKVLPNAEIAAGTLGETLEAVLTRPEAFGPQGVAAEAAERARSIVGGKGPFPVTEARQKAIQNFTRIADSLRVDSGNMNQQELALLREAGDVTGFLESPARAQIKLKGLLNLQMRQLKKRYDVLRSRPSADTIQSWPESALVEAVIVGLLSQAEAEAEYNRRRKK